MANKTLFASSRGRQLPATNTVNHEGAPAYMLQPKHALAQYAATGCFGRTFYATEGEQLDAVVKLCEAIEPEFVARVAVYVRRQAFMKDMPALLCAWLSHRAPKLHERVFPQVIDNARMLRTYVQILRSGVVGRKSLGTAPKRLVTEWFEARTETALFTSSVGQNPSMADLVKMIHPKPGSATREAFYGYLLGRAYKAEALPELVLQFERFKNGEALDVPDLPFTMLAALPLSKREWTRIALNASWQTTRMNINTFARHGVFEDPAAVEAIAARLRDAEQIRKARVFPYQLLSAYLNCDSNAPAEIRDALHDAMEVATANVPRVSGKLYICPDVSGSMSSAVTGHRKGATSAVRCIDVAALVAAALLRKNPSAEVLPFEQDVVEVRLEPRDSVMTNAARLASIGGGGTNCSEPVRRLNQLSAQGDLIVFISDNQSWVDAGRGRGTALMAEWERFRQRNPQARLVCIDVQPYVTTQAEEREDILNIGGFSDQVFEVVSEFAEGRLASGHWVSRIEAIAI